MRTHIRYRYLSNPMATFLTFLSIVAMFTVTDQPLLDFYYKYVFCKHTGNMNIIVKRVVRDNLGLQILCRSISRLVIPFDK